MLYGLSMLAFVLHYVAIKYASLLKSLPCCLYTVIAGISESFHISSCCSWLRSAMLLIQCPEKNKNNTIAVFKNQKQMDPRKYVKSTYFDDRYDRSVGRL